MSKISKMKRKIVLLLLLSILLYFNPLHAMDFNHLKKLLEKNSKQLELKKYNIDISKEDINIINSENYPNINVGFNIEDSKSLNNNISTSVGEYSITSDSLKKSYSYINLNYNLYSFGRLDNKKRIQKYRAESIKYDYCKEKKDLILKLLDIYFNALNNQIKIENFQNIIKDRNNIYKLKNRLFNIGNITKIEVTKSAIEVANLYSQINDSKKELKNFYEQISFLTNYKFLKDEKLKPLMINELKKDMEFENSSTAKELLFQIKSKQAEILLYEKEFLPNLNFYSKYDFYGYDENSYKSSMQNMKKNSYRFGLNLSINFFDGFKTLSQKQKTILELKQLQTQYDLEKKKFDNEILISNQNYQMDKQNLKHKLQNIQLSSSNQTNIIKLENIGELGQIDILNSNIEKTDKHLDYKLNELKLAYEYTKRIILDEGEKCIVP